MADKKPIVLSDGKLEQIQSGDVIAGYMPQDTDAVQDNVASFDGSGNAVDSGIAKDDVVTPSSTDTFTNKTFDADGTGNSISNIENVDIKANAAVDATKIADGSISNTEFQYLDGASSNIQTQITARQLRDGDAVVDNIAKMDSSGDSVDSGLAISDLVVYGGTSSTVTDDATTYFTLGASTSYRAFTVKFTLDDNTNYHYYTTTVVHNGSTTETLIEFSVEGTEMTTITIGSDINAGNVRLSITLASVGTALNIVYNTLDKLDVA